ncbi:hypothetical protein PspLS_09328 [Pyricularia sp. CBS 133598]|nr:hypothetical protein PspLS_09328 [Pyricularia sp. CBS 133598]
MPEKFLELFCRHCIDKTFVVAMVHRHFNLRDTEHMAEFNGTSVPWPAIDGLEKGLVVTPSNWEMTKERLD